MMEPFARKLLIILGVMAVLAMGFHLFDQLKRFLLAALDVLMPFLSALVLAYIMAPVVIYVQRRLRLGRVMGTVVVYLLILLLFFLLFVFLIPQVVAQFIGLIQTLRQELPAWLLRLSEASYLGINPELMKKVRDVIQEIELDYKDIAAWLLPALRRIASGGIEAATGVAREMFRGAASFLGVVSFLVFIGIINFYLILDWEKIGPLLHRMIPDRHRPRVVEVLEKMDRSVGGFLRGQLTVAAIVGTSFAGALLIVGIFGFPVLRNYAILIGTLAGLGGFVPYLGSLVGVTPAILIILLSSGADWPARAWGIGVLLAFFMALQAVEGYVLQPRIVGRGAGLHPLLVLLALMVGYQFGLGGMIIAVPAAGVVRVLVHEFYWRPYVEDRNRRAS